MQPRYKLSSIAFPGMEVAGSWSGNREARNRVRRECIERKRVKTHACRSGGHLTWRDPSGEWARELLMWIDRAWEEAQGRLMSKV